MQSQKLPTPCLQKEVKLNQPGFEPKSHLPLIEGRNDAMRNVFNRMIRQSTARLKEVHKTLKLLYMKRKTYGSSLNAHH